MKYVNSICNTCKFKSTCTESSNHVAECHGYKNDCKNCKSEGTCLDAPKGCTDYRETDEARRSRIEAEVKAHDKRVLRKFIKWLCENYTVLDNHNEEVSVDERRKCNANDRREILLSSPQEK